MKTIVAKVLERELERRQKQLKDLDTDIADAEASLIAMRNHRAELAWDIEAIESELPHDQVPA